MRGYGHIPRRRRYARYVGILKALGHGGEEDCDWGRWKEQVVGDLKEKG